MMSKLERMVRDSIDAWNAHEVDRILSFYSDDVVYEDVPFARVMRGKAELRDFIFNLFSAFPDFRIDVKSVAASGERSVLEWVMSGTFIDVLQPDGVQPTGRSFSVQGKSVGEIEGGKLKRYGDYYDGAIMLEQLGLGT